MSTKHLMWLVCATLIIGLAIAGLAAYNIIQERNLSFCIKSGCLLTAYTLFKEPISTIKYTAALAAYFAAMAGSFIGLATYQESVKKENQARHEKLLSNFKKAANTAIENNPHINKENFNANKLFKLIYPDSVKGNSSISLLYIETIQSIENCVKQTSDSYTTNRFRSEHISELSSLLDTLGITIEEPDMRIIEIEPGIFRFIDEINVELTDITLQLSKMRRNYSVHR
ncbi:retron Ec48 family effector membrane protein [Stutzerimonas stutzeri]